MEWKKEIHNSFIIGIVFLMVTITVASTIYLDEQQVFIDTIPSDEYSNPHSQISNIIFKDDTNEKDDRANTIVRIEPENITVDPGDSFNISIYCIPDQPMKSYELSIEYDASLIHANLVTQGDIFEGYGSFFNSGTINNTLGEITSIYELILGVGNVSDPGYLIHINFTAQQINGTTPINLINIGVTNETAYLPLTINNGSVQIGSPPNQAIILSQENPANNSQQIPITQTNVSLTLTDPENQPINWTIQGPYIQNTGVNQDSNGIKTASLITPLPYNTTIVWYVNATDSQLWTNETYSFTTREQIIPTPPMNFTATPTSTSTIYLSWDIASNTDKTYIEYNTISTWNRGEGILLYNDTANETIQNGLDPHTQYFYQAWSYNQTDNTYSINVSSTQATTLNTPPTLGAPTPANQSTGQPSTFIWSLWVQDADLDLFNWSIECDNGQTNNGFNDVNGIKQLDLNNLDLETTYTIWVNVTDGFDSISAWFVFSTRLANEPDAPTSFNAVSLSVDMINLSWTIGDNTDTTYIEWNTLSTWNREEGTLLYNSTGSSTVHSGLAPHTQYFYQAWGYNQTDTIYSSIYAADNSITWNTPPTIGTPDPANGSIDLETSITWSIVINDLDNDVVDWMITCSNGQSSSDISDTTGLKQLILSDLEFATLYIIWVNVTDGFDSIQEWFAFSTRMANEPDVPTNFSATEQGTSSIYLSWTPEANADTTYIEYNLVSPWNFGEGSIVYNDTGMNTVHTGLNGHTQYFYQAWGYNQTDNVYSPLYASINATTENTPLIHGTPNPANNSIGQPLTFTWTIPITDPDGYEFNWTITCNNGQSNSNTLDTSGIKTLMLTALENDTIYTIWVNSTDGSTTTHTWYQFTTRSFYEPEMPSSFSATSLSTNQIDLSWTPGTNTDTTYIEYNTLPVWNLGQGTLVYNGSGAQTTHTGLSPHTTYYYQAWGYNETSIQYSTTYASDNALTLNTPPTYGTPSPLNQSIDQAISLTWSIPILDADLDPINWQITCNNTQTTGQISDTSGVKSLTFTNLNFDTTYTVWVNATDTYDTISRWYQFTTLEQTPEPPANLSVTATADKILAATGETIQFQGMVTGGVAPYQWSWVFGDGSSSSQQNPTHSYSTTGTFTVTATVTDDTTSTDQDTLIVQIVNPLIITANGPYTATVHETIMFTAVVQGGTPPYSHLWSFGDGFSSNNLTENHTYVTPGLYTVEFTLTDSLGLQKTYQTTATIYTDQLSINIHGPYQGIKGEQVQFTGSASNGATPYTWSWAFGDGYTSTNQNPTHIYQTDGNYTVTLMVTDFLGTSMSTTTTATISKPPYLTINIGGPYTGVINKPVLFSATVLDGKEPYTYLWTLGDGSTTTNATVSHIYTIPGRYDLQVRITDADGRVGTADTYVEIGQNYPPTKPTISGSFRGEAGRRYTFQFTSHDPEDQAVYYFIDWGDGTDSGWKGPYLSGKPLELSHVWSYEDTYTIKVKAKDIHDAESNWATNSVVMPKTNTINYLIVFLEHLMQRFPVLEPLLNFIISVLLV